MTNSRKHMQPDTALAVEEGLDLRQEVTVVAGEQDVAVDVLDGLEGALDTHVHDLLVARAGQRDRAVAHREQRLHEGHRHLAGGGVEEEQRR